jgi:CubicO group peptidase (beta-lactamase class C family)
MKKKIIFSILTVFIFGCGVILVIINYQPSQVKELSFQDMLLYTTRNNKAVVIAVGVIKNGEASYTMYGENGKILPQADHIFEIGSLTKTFTASLAFKALSDKKIDLDDSIDKYLTLPNKDYYPTIRRILTHTSGYKSYYFETQMILNFFSGKNSFYNIPSNKIIKKVKDINLADRDYKFEYSNFGISIIGEILSEIYKKDFTTLMNAHIKEEFCLYDTIISDGSGDLGNYWDWAINDAYIPAGALTSTIGDMLKYVQMQFKGFPEYVSGMHNILSEINATSPRYANLNIRMDSIGAAWIIDSKNNIIWHNGGTSDYNSYLGFDKKKQIGVVILSNLPPNYRIPATVMGVKLLNDLQKDFIN